jgi:hypothetical protein
VTAAINGAGRGRAGAKPRGSTGRAGEIDDGHAVSGRLTGDHALRAWDPAARRDEDAPAGQGALPPPQQPARRVAAAVNLRRRRTRTWTCQTQDQDMSGDMSGPRCRQLLHGSRRRLWTI